MRQTVALVTLLIPLSLPVLALEPIQPIRARKGAKQMRKLSQESQRLPLLSPHELQELAERNKVQTPGSRQYGKKWRYWSDSCIASIRYQLSRNLPHPADPQSFDQLFYDLGTAADKGEMPSFADAGARSAYSIEFFCRVRLLADLIFNGDNLTLPSFWKDALLEKGLLRGADALEDSVSGPCQVVSLGGGPGYDHLALFLADNYKTTGQSKTTIKTIVFDYEEGWSDLVHAMDAATNKAMENPNICSVQWGGKCDITKPLSHPYNVGCHAAVSKTDIFICQYTIAENAKPLRESNFVFFSDLFEAAEDKAIFLFTETTPRVWPDFADILIQKFEGGKGFLVGFPRNTKRGKTGPQLVIQKFNDAALCPLELTQCEKFRQLQKMHERKLKNGFQRQPRKDQKSHEILSQ